MVLLHLMSDDFKKVKSAITDITQTKQGQRWTVRSNNVGRRGSVCVLDGWSKALWAIRVFGIHVKPCITSATMQRPIERVRAELSTAAATVISSCV